MTDKLLVAAMGHRNSGKSTTWNTLFGSEVRTGTKVRTLEVGKGEAIKVFVVSGSPEERDTYVGDLLKNQTPTIVLCSLQYRDGVWDSFSFFFEHEYQAMIQWLNPGSAMRTGARSGFTFSALPPRPGQKQVRISDQ